MKPDLKIFLSCALFLALSCSHLPQYITEETPIVFSVADRGCAFLTVDAAPQDDKVYYTYDIIEKELYDSLGMSEVEVMNYVLDTLRKEYDNFRNLVDPDHSEKYYCTFADFSLYYASSRMKFTNLYPGTEYVVAGFCVNPETVSPMGPLYTLTARTLSWDEVKESDMKFDFMIRDVVEEKEGETRFYVKPMLGDKICKDNYVQGNVISVDTLERYWEGDLASYAAHYITEFSEAGLTDAIVVSDISEFVWSHDSGLLNEGERYIVWAAPYSADYLDKIQKLTFTYITGMTTDYSHD